METCLINEKCKVIHRYVHTALLTKKLEWCRYTLLQSWQGRSNQWIALCFYFTHRFLFCGYDRNSEGLNLSFTPAHVISLSLFSASVEKGDLDGSFQLTLSDSL